jgi:hypothetical protein
MEGPCFLPAARTHGGGLPTRNVCPLLYAATVPLGLGFPTGEVVDMDGAAARCARTDREEALRRFGRPAGPCTAQRRPYPARSLRARVQRPVRRRLQFDHCLFPQAREQMVPRNGARCLSMAMAWRSLDTSAQ